MSEAETSYPTQGDDGVWRDAAGHRCCGAKNRNGTRCRVWVGLGAGHRCKRHGGMSPSGPASPAWKTGRFSKLLPKNLRRHYEQWERDVDRLSCERDVGIIEAQIRERLESLAKNQTAGSAREIRRAFAAFESAMPTKDPLAIQAAFEKLRSVITSAADADKLFAEIVALQATKSKIVDRESRRLLASQTVISAPQAWALVGALVALIRTHVDDPLVRRAIGDGIARLTAHRLPEGTGVN